MPANPTQIFAFAIDEARLLSPLAYQPQLLPGPLFPPGLAKKMTGR